MEESKNKNRKLQKSQRHRNGQQQRSNEIVSKKGATEKSTKIVSRKDQKKRLTEKVNRKDLQNSKKREPSIYSSSRLKDSSGNSQRIRELESLRVGESECWKVRSKNRRVLESESPRVWSAK